jgi:2-ketocyclohexanecarboxyl-CoA hydrolase
MGGRTLIEYQDILFEKKDGVATITVNRSERLNAFRAGTYEEVTDAILDAGWDRDIGVIVLEGAGGKAFGVGGDSADKKSERQRRGPIGIPIDQLHAAIRDVPKPVIAKVRGYAIGGGNVLATLCDLTIAGESAVFGQVGPKVGSVDPGFGTAYLARIVGEKKAREIWYLCRRYSAQEALQMGLVNKVVPDAELDAEVDRWCAEILALSPTAIAIAKGSFNADSENIRGVSRMGWQSVALYYDTDEAKEGGNAFREKRKPNFRKGIAR